MCGIIGYVGPRACRDLLLERPAPPEYRGYDSAGLSLVNERLIESASTPWATSTTSYEAVAALATGGCDGSDRASATRAGPRTAG